MQFKKLKDTVKELGVDTLRVENDNYLEAVIIKNKLTELILKLDNLLGPAQGEPSVQAADVVKEFGGLIKGQTFYFWHEGKSFIFAMLWPWQDGEHITLKMGQG